MLRNKKFQIDKLFITILLLLSGILFAQENKFKIQYNPDIIDSWWLEKNNFGIEPSNFDFQGSWKLKTLKTTYAINILSQEKSVYFNESFIKHNFSDKTFLRVGRYYRDFSTYLNDELSSGSMLISNNAQAMKKIGLVSSQQIQKFENISFDFGIAHATFDKNDLYNEAPLLHEKFIYMNLIKNNYQFSIGFIHEAMWGGSIVGSGKQASKFRDFLRVFIAEDDSIKEQFTHTNALGNHLGLWEFFFQKDNESNKLKLYYQHFFEDTSGLRFANKIDGLWGVEFENYIPNTNILIEYLDTTYQNSDPPYVDDGYYNHYLYKKGWTYKNFTLGNPFINPIKVEPVAILHLGIGGKLKSNYKYKIKTSRDIHIHDDIKYKIEISKSIVDYSELTIFFVNNDLSNGVGASLSIKL